MIKCNLCDEAIDVEHPESIHGTNPQTFRKGWMHSFCFQNAYRQLATEPSKSVLYETKQDEYHQFILR